jgi:serine/threonine protein kinase
VKGVVSWVLFSLCFYGKPQYRTERDRQKENNSFVLLPSPLPRVYKVDPDQWSWSPCAGRSVAIKVLLPCGVRNGLLIPADDPDIAMQQMRMDFEQERNAYSLLQGQPRVVRAWHAFSCRLSLPDARGGPVEAMGFVMEFCGGGTLEAVLDAVDGGSGAAAEARRHLLRLERLSAEAHALTMQVAAMREGLGLVHQDLSLTNIMVRLGGGGEGEESKGLALVIGDLNTCESAQLTEAGRCDCCIHVLSSFLREPACDRLVFQITTHCNPADKYLLRPMQLPPSLLIITETGPAALGLPPGAFAATWKRKAAPVVSATTTSTPWERCCCACCWRRRGSLPSHCPRILGTVEGRMLL